VTQRKAASDFLKQQQQYVRNKFYTYLQILTNNPEVGAPQLKKKVNRAICRITSNRVHLCEHWIFRDIYFIIFFLFSSSPLQITYLIFAS